MDRPTRRRFLAVGGAVASAGCAGTVPGLGDRSSTAGTGGAACVTDASIPLADHTKLLPQSPESIRGTAQSGGPGKDGIPAIDDPSFVPAGDAGFLGPGDIVFGLSREGVRRAYPQKILVWHEICNDTVDGLPVSVTYCPLTGTVLGFLRGETTFGVSGRLVNSNLVMYDRETEAWWPQVLATSIPGPWNEDPGAASLREFRLVWTTWEQWRRRHPDTDVLSTDTGYARNYARDPYGSYNPRRGYYESADTIFPRLNPDDRFTAKTVVLDARTADDAVAFPKAAVRSEGIVEGSLGGEPVVSVNDPRFGTGYVYRNPESLPFSLRDGQVLGPAGSTHEPDALPLARLHAFDAMWFAWSGFYPETSVHE